MRKHAFRYTMILAFLGMTLTLPAGCSNPNEGKLPNVSNGEVNEPEVNKPNTNTDNNNKVEHELVPTTGFIDGSKDENKELEDAIDEEGNLLMPFDEAFPNMMNEVIYDENSILVKAYDKDIKVIYDNLSGYGVINYEYVNTSEKGISWYRLDLKGRTSKALINKFRSVEKTALEFDLNYVLDKNSLYVEETGSTTTNTPEVNTTDCNIDGALGNEFFKDQYYFRDYGLADTYKYITDHGIAHGGEGTVVAVIDTGVDLDHIDLKKNIYVNANEIPDNNIDDDLNGYVDDVHGWNFVDDDNNPDDDHGHGTHVAGIIAADNNLVGTLGIAYNAKIMPVKAADQSGFLTAERIAKAVEYAYMNGADVINMSFGGSYVSLAEQEALQHAYLKSSLVAAAGNDSYVDEPIPGCSLNVIPSYPACYSFVVGVMSVNAMGVESFFTNIDGYYYTSFEYEVYAPGEGIYSTMPGNRYARLTGTSMAAPIVSGMIALLRAQNPNKTEVPNKFLSGQICGTADRHAICCNPQLHGRHHIPSIVNAFAAFTKAPTPDVYMISYKVFDLPEYNPKNNNNGAFDAGETVYIAPILRNRWGLADNVTIELDTLNLGGFESKYVTLSNTKINYGKISTFSTKDYLIYSSDKTTFTGCDLSKSLRVDIKDKVPNGVNITINWKVTCTNGLDATDKIIYKNNSSFVEGLYSGITLPKMINQDMSLTKDNIYIVPENCTINEKVIVNVEAGTSIQFGNGKLEGFGGIKKEVSRFNIYGTLNFNGTQDEMIKVFAAQYNNICLFRTYRKGVVNFKYSEIQNLLAGVPNCDPLNINLDHCIVNYDSLVLNNVLLDGHDATPRYIGAYLHNVVDSLFTIYIPDPFNQDITVGLAGFFERCVFHSREGFLEFFKYRYGYDDTTYWLKDCTIVNENKKTDTIDLTCDKEIAVIPYVLGQSNDYINVVRDGGLLKFLNEKGCYPYLKIADITDEDFKKDQYFYFYHLNGKLYDILDDEIIIENIKNELVKKEMSKCANFTLNEAQPAWFYINIFTAKDGTHSCNLNEAYEITYVEIYKTNDCSFDDIFRGIYQYNGSKTTMDNANINLLTNNFANTKFVVATDACIKNDTIQNVINTNFTNPEINDAIIKDGNDDPFRPTLGQTNDNDPMLEKLWPYVKKCEFLDKDGNAKTVFGKELMKVRLTMNRDMDINEELHVSFGSATPFADYEIEGKWIDARTWEGSAFINASLENGKQSLSIYGGCAADDRFKTVQEALGRLSFNIDTSAAMAKTITATPGDEGITLNWFQDEYKNETIMGYNIYRSDKEFGNYKRVNRTIIAPNETSFLDKTVYPGESYWYTFTIVLSDMSETKPAGRISTMSKDTMSPELYHTPVKTAYSNNSLKIVCTAKDNIEVESAKVYYRTKGQTDYKVGEMIKNNDTYSYTISNLELSLEGLEYYIVVSDGTNNIMSGSAANPHFVDIFKGELVTTKGDVDGDQELTVADVQMMLKHIYGEILLKDDQFKRADFDGNGEISTAEALRLLQYINGKIDTL